MRQTAPSVPAADLPIGAGIRDLVHHPGSHGGEGEAAGVARIAASLDEAFRLTEGTRVRVLLETAAGQGTAVGHRFEHLRDILGAVRQRRRVAVCLDTCHVHAAGYETPKDETLDLDRRNLAILRRLATPSPPAGEPEGWLSAAAVASRLAAERFQDRGQPTGDLQRRPGPKATSREASGRQDGVRASRVATATERRIPE